MTVEDQMNENAVSLDGFPVGMRVLAVDDDPVCLKVLETLLRKCQYQVTTTKEAIKALQILRENRNMYDLVISDVNMPDVDGFKLLELVGLEMDLPVIMLSAHSDTKLVMKGVMHGACDYLLKPVRIEELKNVWQHVVRRKKNSNKSAGPAKGCPGAGGGTLSEGDFDQNPKPNRKRKDKDCGEDDDDSEDEAPESEDPSSQKKSRVVWTPDLHKKFIDAVLQLGYEKAFPKKILDLMNVEGLTRENVASHLQKFRQLLKRAEAIERQRGRGAIGGVKDLSYMRMGSLNPNEVGDLRSYTNTALSPSVSHTAMIGRFNSPRGFAARGIASPAGISQPSNPFTALGKFLPGNQTPSPFQGFASPLELSQFQPPQTKSSSDPLGDLNSLSTAPAGFSALAGFQAPGTTFGGLNSGPGSSSGGLVLQGAPSNPQSSDLGIGGGSSFMDRYRCNEPWQSAIQSSTFTPTQTGPGNFAIPSTGSLFGNSSVVPSPATGHSSPLMDSRDVLGRDGLIGNIVPTDNFDTRQTWEGGFNNNNHNNMNQNFSAFNQNNAVCKTSIFDQLDGSTSIFPSNGIERSSTGTTTVKPNDVSLLDQGNKDGLITNSYESLDDILNSLIKRDQNDTLMNEEFGFDNFPLGSCM